MPLLTEERTACEFLAQQIVVRATSRNISLDALKQKAELSEDVDFSKPETLKNLTVSDCERIAAALTCSLSINFTPRHA
jgi:hypothetical protein